MTSELVPLSELRADHDAAVEPKVLKVLAYRAHILIIELILDHCKKPGEPFRSEHTLFFAGNYTEPLQHRQIGFEHPHRAMQNRTRIRPEHTEPVLALGFDGLIRERVDIAHNFFVPYAVIEDLLTIENRSLIHEALKKRALRYVIEKTVACGHRLEEDIHIEILHERVCLRRKRRLRVEISIFIH